MFPLIILILHETVRPVFVVLGYDVILPLIIYFVSKRTLEYRPMGFSAPDITMHPKYEKMGKLSWGDNSISIWPVALAISIGIILVGIYFTGTADNSIYSQISTSLVITWGIGLGPVIYFLLHAKGKLDLRESIRNMELELGEALFSLGNRLSLGEPVEKAMEVTVRKNEELNISDLFKKALRNMKKGGMDLKNSIFDKKFGAVWDYPSKMIISILRIVVEGSEKGVQIASLSAISISKYLKQIHRIEEDLKDMLSSETTSMEFLGAFLGPLVAGISVTMAGIMMVIFRELGATMEQLQPPSEAGMQMGLNSMMIGGWGSVEKMIPASWFQIIVGIYIIEVCYLLAMLTSGIENGPEDDISKKFDAGVIILMGLIVYSFSMLLTWQIFGGQIQNLMGGGLI
jgi:hypothetical protein